MVVYYLLGAVLLLCGAFVAGVLVGRKHPSDIESIVKIVKK